MYADMIWKKGLEHFHFGNRWGYDIIMGVGTLLFRSFQVL